MKTLPTVLLTALIVGAPLGYCAYNRYQAALTLQKYVDDQDGQHILTAQTFVWDDGAYTIEHLCEGTVKEIAYPSSGPQAFCVGTNTLQLKDAQGNLHQLDILEAEKDVEAPFLSDVYQIPGNEEGALLINFTPDRCYSTADCGVGQTFVREFTVNLADPLSARPLKNITRATALDLVWNPAGTKALIRIPTQGGAGYSVSPIQGYDLATDTLKNLTTEEAATPPYNAMSSDPEDYTTVTGELVPHWYISSSAWTSDTHFKVDLYATDGTKTTVEGDFE